METLGYKSGSQFDSEVDKVLTLNDSIYKVQCKQLESRRNRRRDFITFILDTLPTGALDLPISSFFEYPPTENVHDPSSNAKASKKRGKTTGSKACHIKRARKIKPVTKIAEFSLSTNKDRSMSKHRYKDRSRSKKKPKSALTKHREASGRKMDEEKPSSQL